MELIKVENLYKEYRSGEDIVKALDHISFSIEKGEFVAITGASGSGKSTLLHILGGVDKPTKGKIVIDGQDITKWTEKEFSVYRRRTANIIYQFYNLIPILNVEDNINFSLEVDKKEIDKQKLDEILKIIGLQDKRKNFPNQLSGGQQQRVAIGRSLMTNSSILLADEPTGNLDHKNSEEIIELLKKQREKYNQTIILVTHDITIANQADRIITLQDGKII